MEATVAERGQITLPKAVRDALGLTKGTRLKVELEGGAHRPAQGRVETRCRALRGRFKLPTGFDHRRGIMRELRGRAPGDPYPPPDDDRMIAIDTSVLVDLHRRRARPPKRAEAACAQA